jgi:hypothetical protein
MTAQELRIGNYVNCPKDGQNPFRIDLFDYLSNGIGKLGMIYDKSTHPLTWYLQNLKPIPLTEEWLLKLGLIKTIKKKDTYYVKRGQCFCFENSELAKSFYKQSPLYLYLPEERIILNASYPILYVHQLQNLYFALTGQELTIKEL